MVLRKCFYIRWSARRYPRVHEVNPGWDPSARVFLQTQTQEKKGKRVCLLPQIFGFFNTKVPSCS